MPIKYIIKKPKPAASAIQFPCLMLSLGHDNQIFYVTYSFNKKEYYFTLLNNNGSVDGYPSVVLHNISGFIPFEGTIELSNEKED